MNPVSQVRAQIAEAAQRRDWQAARGAFDAVEAPVTPVWEAILHAADRCERLADAEELFGRMQADRSCRLRVRSFNSMVNLNSRRGDVGRVEELLATMRAESIRPDAMLYSAILNGYARSGDVEAATRAWQEMLDAGIRPTSVSYVSLLNVLAEAKLPDLAVARVEEMSACGLVPQVQHWNAVLKACQRAPDSEAALRNLARMKESGARRPTWCPTRQCCWRWSAATRRAAGRPWTRSSRGWPGTASSPTLLRDAGHRAAGRGHYRGGPGGAAGGRPRRAGGRGQRLPRGWGPRRGALDQGRPPGRRGGGLTRWGGAPAALPTGSRCRRSRTAPTSGTAPRAPRSGSAPRPGAAGGHVRTLPPTPPHDL
ncbi:unnamed protein product [Prorocentrum cordatum]|uniref:Pentacotripeptide-repeat region of PRORP domain-containing protein n=1 Tax=Prorocentrum cordatum TaxID=2364126 RepID=A0ABN9SPU5_9DINO|nr:unnamed protein product [Polarella glacialis]